MDYLKIVNFWYLQVTWWFQTLICSPAVKLGVDLGILEVHRTSTYPNQLDVSIKQSVEYASVTLASKIKIKIASFLLGPAAGEIFMRLLHWVFMGLAYGRWHFWKYYTLLWYHFADRLLPANNILYNIMEELLWYFFFYHDLHEVDGKLGDLFFMESLFQIQFLAFLLILSIVCSLSLPNSLFHMGRDRKGLNSLFSSVILSLSFFMCLNFFHFLSVFSPQKFLFLSLSLQWFLFFFTLFLFLPFFSSLSLFLSSLSLSPSFSLDSLSLSLSHT